MGYQPPSPPTPTQTDYPLFLANLPPLIGKLDLDEIFKIYSAPSCYNHNFHTQQFKKTDMEMADIKKSLTISENDFKFAVFRWLL